MASKSNSNLNKRQRIGTDDDSSSQFCIQTTFNKFYVIESTLQDKQLSQLSPFVIEKCIQGNLGTVNKVSKMRSGCLLIEINRQSQVAAIEKMKDFFNIPIKVSPHRSLNSCKGVVRSRDLAAMDSDEITQELQHQNVVDTYIMKKDGKKLNTLILTFKGNTIPTHIKAGYMNIPVQPYIPAPMRCFNCQKLGHLQTHCRNEKHCATCGKVVDENHPAPCKEPPHCVNCGGAHQSYDKTCLKYITEQAINKTKIEAKKITLQQETNNTTTYAKKVVENIVKDQSTQTDLVNCVCGAIKQLERVAPKRVTSTQTEVKGRVPLSRGTSHSPETRRRAASVGDRPSGLTKKGKEPKVHNARDTPHLKVCLSSNESAGENAKRGSGPSGIGPVMETGKGPPIKSTAKGSKPLK